MRTQLKAVQIPTFSFYKRTYPSWMACVNRSPVLQEYKNVTAATLRI